MMNAALLLPPEAPVQPDDAIRDVAVLPDVAGVLVSGT
jgi:hypothetical protein